MNARTTNIRGFSLVELLIVIVIIGILTALAMQSMTALVKDARTVKTEREMEMLANAIVGDASLMSGGTRSDFGYVGDIGAFPSSLQDLYTNPGGFSTWTGPYIKPGYGEDITGFKTDEWGTAYTYAGGITISSTGGGSTITKKIADATTDYTLNQLNGKVKDANDSLPGPVYRDSVSISVTVPNGTGGTLTKSYTPDSLGNFTLDSLPVGKHPLRVIYLPNVDTLFRYVTILPRHKSSNTYHFASGYFASGGGGGGAPASEILRPIGPGSSTQLLDENCNGGWSCVDEVTPDGDGTFVKGAGGSWLNDTYATQNSAVGAGTIDSVKVFIHGRKKQARTAIRTYGVLYEGVDISLPGSYTTYSTTYATNPNTTAAWTWAEIDALEIGVTIKGGGFVTQVWVEVYYRS